MSDSSLTVKDWLITLVITAIPVVGIIMLFVWAFGNGTPEAKANWAKAALLLMAIFFVLYLVFGVLLFGSILATGSY